MKDWLIEAAERRAERRGREEGREEGMEKMVRKLAAEGVAPDVIARSADWPIDRVRAFVN